MARRARNICAVLAVCLFATTGCVKGMLYTHITVPLDTDFNNTPVHSGGRGDSWKTLVIPLFKVSGRVQFDFGDISITNAMEKAGIETAHYADLETRSFFGIWTQHWVHVYGE